MNSLKYPETEIVPLAGDIVRFWDDSDSDTMTVEEVISGEEARKRWGIDEDGIMMIGPKYGRIFDTLGVHYEVELVQRLEKIRE